MVLSGATRSDHYDGKGILPTPQKIVYAPISLYATEKEGRKMNHMATVKLGDGLDDQNPQAILNRPGLTLVNPFGGTVKVEVLLQDMGRGKGSWLRSCIVCNLLQIMARLGVGGVFSLIL